MEKDSIGIKIISIIFVSAFLITSVLGVLSFSFSKRRLVIMLGEYIKGVATTTANFIKDEDILKIVKGLEEKRAKYFTDRAAVFSESYHKPQLAEAIDPEKSLELYNSYTSLLAGIKAMNNIDGPVNVYIKDKGKFKIVLTSDKAVVIGAPYHLVPEAERTLFYATPHTTRIYTDKDGRWISAYAPVPATIPIVLEVSYKIDSYLVRLTTEFWIILLTCLFVFAITILISYKYINKTILTIKKLDMLATDLEEEKYDVPIDIRSRDEIGHLAQTFEKMRLSIKTRLGELRLSLLREKKAHLESVIVLMNALGIRDPQTRQHLYRVEKYALLIAKEMGLPRKEMERLRYGCYLHDIGKLEIEAAVLQKVKLSHEDFEQVKKHSEKGAKIIEGVEFFEEIRDVVLHHQEHYDGSGYPKGLKGDEIPLLARIVAAADAFDAMTTDRPYRAKMSFDEAMNRIEKDSGKQFDPKVAAALLKYRKKMERIAKRHFKDNLFG